MAEGLLRSYLTQAGVPASVGSAGLLPGGSPATDDAVAVMSLRGIDIRRHRSRTLNPAIARGTPLIIGMTRQHVREACVTYGAPISRTFTLKELVRRGEQAGPRRSGENVSAWLAGPSVALLSIMMLNVWTTAGTMMVIFLAGLQDVPGDVYEAASLDGASRWRMFRDITVPLLRPVTLFVVTLGLIGTFQVFDQIWIMTEGGPAKTTTTVAYLIYLEGFKNFSMGYAAALAVVLFALIFLLFLAQRRFVGESTER